MKISIVVPVYNTAEHLSECIESLLKQDVDDLEIICIDDGSTDNSKDILNVYAQKNESIVVIEQENQGVSASRNRGIKIAQGDYILFVDSDDRLKPNCLGGLYELCKEHELDIAYYSYENFADNKEIQDAFHKKYNKSIRKGIYSKNIILSGAEQIDEFVGNNDYVMSACVGLFRRDYIIKKNIFFAEDIIYEDAPFSLLALINAQKVICTNDVCYERRIRHNSIEHSDFTAKHLYGYMKSCMYMFDYLERYENECIDIVDACEKVMERRINRLIDMFKSIEPNKYKDFIKLCSPIERIIFTVNIEKRVIAIDKRERKIKKYKKDIKKLEDSIHNIKSSKQFIVGEIVLKPFVKIKRILIGIRKRMISK